MATAVATGQLTLADHNDAIILTNLTSPGAFVGQLGFYNGLFYKWSGTAWDLIDATPPTDTPAFYLSFDKIVDGKVLDGSGNGVNGTVVGSTLVDGVCNKGISTQAESQYVSIPTPDFGSAFTLSIWYNPGTAVAGTHLGILGGFPFAGNSTQGGISLAYYGTSDYIYFDLYSATLRYSATVASAFSRLSGTHHWVLQYNGSSMRIFRDGVLLGNSNIGSVTVSSAGIPNFYFGHTARSGIVNGIGFMDEAILYKRALSDAEIRGLYLSKGLSKLYAASDYQLAQVAADSVITPQEKSSLLARWCALYNDTAATGALSQAPSVEGRYKTLRDSANALGIWTPTTDNTAAKDFYTAVEALRAYLFTTPAVLLAANWNTNIAITKATWLSLWMTAESTADALQAAISAKEADDVVTTTAAISLPFDILSAGSTPDASGNGRNATVTGGVLETGLFGNCLAFNGDDYVITPAIAITPRISYSIWYKKIVDANMFLIDHRAAEVGCHPIYIDSGNMINFFDSGTGYCTSDFQAAKSDGSWHHIVCTGSPTSMKIYHDGILVGSTAYGITPQTARAIYVGARHTLTGYFQGSLDEFKVFPRELTAAEVLAMYRENPESVAEDVPGYIGKYRNDTGETPSNPKKGQFWVVFGEADSGAAPHTGYQRGVWLKDKSGITRRITSSDSMAAYYMPMSMDDIVWAVDAGFGDYDDYDFGQYIKRLSTAVLLAQEVNALAIKIGKSLRAGDAFDEDGNPIEGSTGAGAWLGSDGTMKLVNAIISGNLDAVGGTFKGLVRNATMFNMREAQSGSPVNFASKTRWLGSSFWNAMTAITSPSSFVSATGTIGGKTVSYLARPNSASARATMRAPTTHAVTPGFSTWTEVDSWTSPFSDSGCLITAKINEDAAGYWGIRIKKNGSVIASDTQAWASQITLSVNADLAVGDVITMETWRFGNSTYDVDYLGIYSGAGQRMIAQFNDNTYGFYKYDGFYSAAVAITSPNTFTSAAGYATGLDYVNAVSAYTLGQVRNASGTLTVNGTAKTVTGVMKYSATEARVYFNDSTYGAYISDQAEGATAGWYNVSGSYTLSTQTQANETVNIIPFSDAAYDLGEDTTGGYAANKRFRDLALSRNLRVGGAAAITGNFSCAVATPTRVDCYAVDDDSAPLGSKTTTATAGVSFTVYKPILVRLSAEVDGPSYYLDVRYNGSYIQMQTGDYYTVKFEMLAPGNYKLRTSSAGAQVAIRCLGVYGANSASTFWS